MPRLFDLLSGSSDEQKLRALAQPKRPAPPAKKAPAAKPMPLPLFEQETSLPLVPEFVALDFETTGLDDKNERVIEVGAIRFVNGVPIAEISMFINPQKPIPPEISDLTGIRDADVATAKKFSEIADELVAFIGTAPLCGHQIDFDVGFLKAELIRCNKAELNPPQLDTALLSRIVLSDLKGYSLSNVSDALEVPLTTAHRALDDAKASGFVALKLLNLLGEIPYHIRKSMAHMCPASYLKSILFATLGVPSAHPYSSKRTLPPIGQKLLHPDELIPVDQEKLTEFFSENGALSQTVDTYTIRNAQQQMAKECAAALSDRSFLVSEAQTGTGKSLAYLVPAALFAQANNCRVLVATHTRNLQDQLIAKDIPLVKKALGTNLSFSVLKGRSNYICRRRFQKLAFGELGYISARERAGALPLVSWIERTTTGDIEEQQQFNRSWYRKVWNLISAETHECKNRACPAYGECFFQRARQKALSSHIVVINHALFFSEVCAETSFLGPIDGLIFDEAHHLEASGHQHLRTEVDTNRFMQYIDFMSDLQKKIEKIPANPACDTIIKSLKTSIKRLRKASEHFLTRVSTFASPHSRDGQVFAAALAPDQYASDPDGLDIDITLKDVGDTLHTLLQHITAPEKEDTFDGLGAEAALCNQRTSQLRADLIYLCKASTPGHVFWAEGKVDKNWIKICGVSLDIGAILSQVWHTNKMGVIFTSATLFASDSHDACLTRFGLTGDHKDKTIVNRFTSPFSKDQSLLVAAPWMAEPDDTEYAQSLATTIEQISCTFKRNMLVLFTSLALMNRVYSMLRASSKLDRQKVLAQGLSGNRHHLLTRMHTDKGIIVLGADSFWEGIDAPGETCEIVVITRLPFIVPSHPLTVALAQQHETNGGDSFFTFALPEAIIRFRQGIGRLIRTENDRGVLLVLDRRLVTKGYGKQFIKAYGSAVQQSTDSNDMVAHMDTFFNQPHKLSKTLKIDSEPQYVPFDDL